MGHDRTESATRPSPWRRRHGVLTLLVVALAACAPGTAGPEAPRPGEPVAVTGLPPIPRSTGPLALRVVYPAEDAPIAVRDSNFIFGSTGTGEASLRINDVPVRVEPNGAWLAFLPVPPDGVYRIDAVAGLEVANLIRRVRIPTPLVAPAPGTATILAGSLQPRGGWAALPGERIQVSFRGTPGGTATLRLPDGSRAPLVEARVIAAPGGGTIAEYRGFFPAQPIVAAEAGVARPTLSGVTSPGREAGAVVEFIVGRDTARVDLPLNLVVLDPDRPRVGIARDPDPIGQGGDALVVGRPGPGLTYQYFWPDGTRLQLSGERGGEYRVQLTPMLTAWVPIRDVVLQPVGTPVPGGRIGTVRFVPTATTVDVRLAVPEALPFRVDETERTLELTLYGGVSDTDFLMYGGTDPLIEQAVWSQPNDVEYRLTLRLARSVWGYHVFMAENGDLVLRVRRPPAIDPRRPLQGLLIAVDPGHPPGGAIGPTGLTEAEANLAIALRLQPMLEAAGARVLMTRTGPGAVSLQERPRMAFEADADLFVSVHNNAFPDGVNPFVNAGTSMYYFFPRAVDLARDLQREVLVEFGLRDLGVGRGNFAVIRNPWFPAVLTESMFLMIPQQESALRDPGAQDRLARAHFRAIERFLRSRAVD